MLLRIAQLAIRVDQQNVDFRVRTAAGQFAVRRLTLPGAVVKDQDHHCGDQSGKHDESYQHDQGRAV